MINQQVMGERAKPIYSIAVAFVAAVAYRFDITDV